MGVDAYGIAILPPPEAARGLLAVRRIHPLLRHAGPPHITIKSPFVPRHTPALLLERLAEAVGPIEPFELRLDGLGSFGHAVLYVHVQDCAALRALHRVVVEALEGMVETFEPRHDGVNFTPHLTLAEKLTAAEFEAARRALGGFRPRATFRVERLHLLKGARGTSRDGTVTRRWEPGRSVELGTSPPLERGCRKRAGQPSLEGD